LVQTFIHGWSSQSVAEVVKGQRQIADVFAQQSHDRLQVVAFRAGDAHGVALNGGLDFDFESLMSLTIFFASSEATPFLTLMICLTLSPPIFCTSSSTRKRTSTLRLAHLLRRMSRLGQAEIRSRQRRLIRILFVPRGIGAFEVKTAGDFFVALVYGVAQFDGVGFEYGIE